MAEPFGAYSSYISSQIRNLKEDPRKNRRSGNPFVTISRQTGAYGVTVADALEEYLRSHGRGQQCLWTVFEKELLKKVAEQHKLPEAILPYLSESTISELQDMLEETLGLHPSQYTLAHKTSETILHLARLGYVIIVGRGANIITAPLPGGVHVRLVGSLERRVHNIQQCLKMDQKKARDYVRREDQDRINYIKKYFGKNINDPLLYDLVINVDRIPPQEAVVTIANLVFKRSANPCDDLKTI